MGELLASHHQFEIPVGMTPDQLDDLFLEELAAKVEAERASRLNLGDGKVAKVWYTENPATHNLICVKELVNPDVSVNTFERELELHDVAYLAGVDVPAPYFYISTKGSGTKEGGGHQYIFMERIIGTSVEDKIKNKEFLGPDEFATFEQSLREELDLLHNKAHILHRDLHPGNVMVTPDNRAKLIDFGDSVEDVGQFDTEKDRYSARVIRDGHFVDTLLPHRDEQIFQKIQRLRA